MKKLLTLCFLLSIAFTVKAQDKPTKEQTIAFIKDYFANTHIGTGTYLKKKDTYVNSQFSDFNIVFDGYIMELSYKELFEHTYTSRAEHISNQGITYLKHRLIIDFGKIEKIDLSFYNLGDNMFQSDLDMTAALNYTIEIYANNITVRSGIVDGKEFSANIGKGFEDVELPNNPERKNSVSLPIRCYSAGSDFDHSEYNKKILQAFNHLRKLCGAPEPINFDN